MEAISIDDVERSGSAERFYLPFVTGNHVVSGCEVAPADGSPYQLSIAAGVVSIHGREVNVPGHTGVQIRPPANGERRLDLVVADADGHVLVLPGRNDVSYPAPSP